MAFVIAKGEELAVAERETICVGTNCEWFESDVAAPM